MDQGEPSPAFEGNSSLAAHSAYASKFLETAVSQSALQMSSPKIEAALSTLKQIVNMQDQQPTSRGVTFRHQKAVPRTGLRDLKMPPTQVVVALLRKIKCMLVWISAFLDADDDCSASAVGLSELLSFYISRLFR